MGSPPFFKGDEMISKQTEEVTVVGGLPLRLSFEPEAIRQHFESVCVTDMDFFSDETLAQIAAIALQDDELYAAFNSVLRSAFIGVLGFDPDDTEEEDDDDGE
jgi:hypothetical protein